ncbi:hypothetical protein CSB11_02915 [Candidatus Campbellbacteria bacterium]|nr:MAG: hypothetical protein CSB11_02915 [Candidatus Campbellbacteria bacterium]
MFDTFFYEPVYNLVIFLANFIHDLGWVIVVATIIIKFILFPLYNRQINTQIATKKAKPELDAIKEKYGKNASKEERQKMAFETLAIYKKYNIRPFASILLLLIQIPILFALYWIFYKGGLPGVDKSILYSFVSEPDQKLSLNFLNHFDLANSSVVLAVVAAITQYIQLAVSMPDVRFADLKKKTGRIGEDMAVSMQVNLKYGLPLFILFLLSTTLSAAIAIYWITSNVFMTVQEYFVRHKKAELRKKDNKVEKKEYQKQEGQVKKKKKKKKNKKRNR